MGSAIVASAFLAWSGEMRVSGADPRFRPFADNGNAVYTMDRATLRTPWESASRISTLAGQSPCIRQRVPAARRCPRFSKEAHNDSPLEKQAGFRLDSLDNRHDG